METNGRVEETESGGGARSVLCLPPGSSLSLSYGPRFGSHDDLLLLEVDESLIHEILHKGVSVRGEPDEDAVVCTDSATYAMKFVGTSNSVFLIPPGEEKSEISENESASVFKIAPGHIELVQVAPRLEKLKSLLRRKPYILDEEEEEDIEMERENLYRWEDLINTVQSSEEELMSGLRSLPAVEINGCWRIVAEKSIDEIVKMMLNNCIIHDWNISSMKEDEVVSVLESDGFPRFLILNCLTMFGHRIKGQSEVPIWRLDEKPICLHFAKQLLRAGKMKMEAFMAKWNSAIPDGMKGELGMLEGEILYETLGLDTWIKPFSISDLPSTPEERFAALFQERAKWARKDLQPFIRDLRVPGLSSEALLIKYTQRTQPIADAEPIFSAR